MEVGLIFPEAALIAVSSYILLFFKMLPFFKAK
jgi:hypothetical protein